MSTHNSDPVIKSHRSHIYAYGCNSNLCEDTAALNDTRNPAALKDTRNHAYFKVPLLAKLFSTPCKANIRQTKG